MKNLMISFIGEQPIPNLIPIKFEKPEITLLVHTERTEKKAKCIENLLKSNVEMCKVDAYDIPKIFETVKQKIEGNKSLNLIFNLTGGTKAMAFAGYGLALQYNSPFLYFQTEGIQMRIYYYIFEKGLPSCKRVEIIKPLINIDDYLRVHIGKYQETKFRENDPGVEFEKTIYDALKPSVDELKPGIKIGGALDIDLVIRCKNYVGIAEIKMGKNKALNKKGIDQLNTAGGREYLGIYTTKFLIIDRKWDSKQSNLRDLAEARNICLIELPSYGENKKISEYDRTYLKQKINKRLHCYG